MAVFRVAKTKDYTVMSNHHLRNTSLSMKAKGLLSLMLSLPDNWDYTLFGLSTISSDGLCSIRAAVGELEAAGYLIRRRLRNGKGQLSETEYTILEQPEILENTASLPTFEKPILDYTVLEKPILGNPTSENRTQSNTNVSTKNKSNTHLSSIHQSIHHAVTQQTQGRKNTPEPDKLDMMGAIEVYRKIIKENIEYDYLLEQYNSDRLDEIVQLILDVLISMKRTFRIDSADCSAELVKSRLLKLGSEHIEYVLECMEKTTSKIKNIRNYMLTALFNSMSTIDSYYLTTVNHDLHSDH